MINVIAILTADIHLSHTPPLARSSEPDWYAAMARPLEELRQLSKDHHVPIICAGDVVDRWNAPPELINFAIEKLPMMYAVPGQHDLPHHRLEDVKRSAYWTLVKAGVLWYCVKPKLEFNLHLWPFPWGKEITPPALEEGSKTPQIAICHKYIWKGQCKYVGAPKKDHISKLAEQLDGYDLAVFGDNHKGFQAKLGGCEVFNCGSLMRRRADEIAYKPRVGLLMDDGTIQTHYLDTSQDKMMAIEKVSVGEELDVSQFIAELEGLDADSLEFGDAVERYMHNNGTDKAVRELVAELIEGVK